MKSLPVPIRFLAVFALVGSLLALPLLAAASAQPTSSKGPPGQEFGVALTKLTGIAISPLLGAGVVGAWEHFSADEEARASLPWFAKPAFFVPALLLVAGVAAKDAFGAVAPPALKKPLDVLEVVEDKASALVAAGVVLPSFGILMKEQLFAAGPAVEATLATAGLPVAAGMGDILLTIMTLPFTAAAYICVWLVSHAITVLILLSPFPLLDAILKAARVTVLASLGGLASIAPQTAGLFSLVIVIICALLAGWAFRLTVFGSVFAWDFLTLKRRRFRPAPERLPVFSSGPLKGVPRRSWGRLIQSAEDGTLSFTWRPWLVLAPRTVAVPVTDGSLRVGRGLFYSVVHQVTEKDGRTVLFILPPRYRGNEEALVAAAPALGEVEDAGLRRGLKAAFQWLRELIGGAPEVRASAA